MGRRRQIRGPCYLTVLEGILCLEKFLENNSDTWPGKTDRDWPQNFCEDKTMPIDWKGKMSELE